MSAHGSLGTDLRIIEHEVAGKDITVEQSARGKLDIATVAGVDNLIQTLNLRLNARKGSLRELGHPQYGSRLDDLIGRLNTPANRRLLEAYTRESLRQEPRIKEIVSIHIDSLRAELGRVDVHITVKPIDSEVPVNLVFPFRFEG